ncbi:heme-binding protein 2-like [Lissotriton helveticus]
MYCGLGALLLLLSATSSSGTRSSADADRTTPRFCRSRDCPKYELVKKYDTFEERNYESSRWVSTLVEGKSYSHAIVEGFWRLFHYIDGKNSAGIKIPMTVPVLSRVNPVGVKNVSDITMSFFVPFAVDDPPTPTNPEVYLSSTPAQTVYVKSFGGYAFKSDFVEMAEKLSQDLNTLGKPFQKDFFITAGYDAPFMLFNRHNEVWYIAE